MYPLNVSLPAPAVGFAVANDAAEHATLTEAGYLPALLPAEDHAETVVDTEAEIAAVKAQLDKAGIKYHPNTGLPKLKALLPAED